VKSKRPIALDFFCGAGGLSLGFQQAGFDVVAAFDSDPIHVEAHAKNFPKSFSCCADVRTLTGKTVRKLAGLQKVDIVIGGPPCQGFSMIGKRKMDDPRNSLLEEYCRLIGELSPSYFIIENVAGLMYGGARQILAHCLRKLRNDGFKWVTPIKILDAADYGIPQRRKRVIVLGYKRGEPKPEYPAPTRKIVTVKQAIGDLEVIGNDQTLFKSDVFSGRLGRASRYARQLRIGSQELTGCLRAVHTKEVVRRFKATRPGQVEPISHFPRLHELAVSPTLRAGTPRQYGGFTAARPIHPKQHRCITVREAARLHSFPDQFTFHPTQWHGFRQVGNAVPPALAKIVAHQLIRLIKD